MRIPFVRIALLATLVLPFAQPAFAETATDLLEARKVFMRNLDAIQRRDRPAYLATYLPTPSLAVTGPTGFTLGYETFVANAGTGWPDHFEALDLRLTPVRDGVVYGTYRYRVRYGATEQSGLSERLFLETPQGWRIAMTSAFASTPGVPAPPRAIVGGTLLDGTGRAAVEDAIVLVRDGRIEALGPSSLVTIPAGYETIDARGRFMVPGLVDVHVHYSQSGWPDARPDALDLRSRYPYDATVRRLRENPTVFHRAWLTSGVTTVQDAGGFPWTVEVAKRSLTDTESPLFLATGPTLVTRPFDLNLPGEHQFITLEDSASAIAAVRYLRSIGASAVSVWFLTRPTDDFERMARLVLLVGGEAAQQRLPLVVHATGLREAKVGLRAGAKLLARGVQDRALDVEFLSLAKTTGAFYCPTLTASDGYARLPQAARSGLAPRLDDPLGAVDSLTRARIALTANEARRVLGANPPSRVEESERIAQQLVENLTLVRRNNIPVVVGTDAGNPLTPHGAAYHTELAALQAAGMKPLEVLIAGTRDASRALGRFGEVGTIEKGKSADLLVLSADPRLDAANLRRIEWVMRSGVARSATELRAAVARSRW
jgi:imidazolonepropionase-like amidohydrolase